MKKYLFGLGTMLVGAGLMFVFTHTEVSAEGYNKVNCEIFESDIYRIEPRYFTYCKIKDLTCVSTHRKGGISCVKN